MKYIVGIDEAGRGPLAGPVAVGIFVIAENKLKKLDLTGLKDSKKLSKKKREEWREKIKKNTNVGNEAIASKNNNRQSEMATRRLKTKRLLNNSITWHPRLTLLSF